MSTTVGGLGRPLRYQHVVDELRRRIAGGVWQPGERIPTGAALSRELGVGLSSVREALRILGNDQTLRIEHGRGIFVADAPKLPPGLFDHMGLSAERTLAALFEARRLIEPGIAGLAARNATDEDVEIIEQAAHLMAKLAAAGEDFQEPDIQLHRQIALAAGNPFLAKMMKVALDLFLESRLPFAQMPGMPARASQYHVLIAGAIKERDPSRAEALMRAHLDDTIAALKRHGRVAPGSIPRKRKRRGAPNLQPGGPHD